MKPPSYLRLSHWLLAVLFCLAAAGCATLPPAGDDRTAQCLSAEALARKKALRLKEIAVDLREQRQTTADFGGHLTSMGNNLAGYNRYIQAGSIAAAFAKVFPIPYAGQVGVFAKFVAQSSINLNNASRAVTAFNTSSQTFLKLADRINPEHPDAAVMEQATRFADQELLGDMHNLKQKLASVSDLSAGSLSFLESLQQYLGSTDEYWNKTKGLFKKDIDPKEKSFLSASIASLKGQTDSFNQRLQRYNELTTRQTSLIKGLTLFDELSAELQSATGK